MLNILLHMCLRTQSSEIEPADGAAANRDQLVQALQARINSLERELRESDNTHRLRCGASYSMQWCCLWLSMLSWASFAPVSLQIAGKAGHG